MTDKVEATLDDFAVTLEFSVREVNALLNILNTPIQVPAVTLVNFINAIQMQALPQVEKAKAGLEAVFNADGVPKDLEEKN
jgi:hypothetical protein